MLHQVDDVKSIYVIIVISQNKLIRTIGFGNEVLNL